MSGSKADIIAKLQRDLLPLQGFRNNLDNASLDQRLGPIRKAFPGNHFPLGAMHEFICDHIEGAVVTIGFIAGLVAPLMERGGVAIWIGSAPNIFPPSLQSFGINPGKIIFIDLQKEKDILWAMEEALKCDGLAAVIGELKELNFTASRRLQ